MHASDLQLTISGIKAALGPSHVVSKLQLMHGGEQSQLIAC